MTNKWPQFITKDIAPDDDAEMTRRWEAYNREMQAIIKAGGVHQDEDGWWVDDATGELIGPDPETERPLTEVELARAKPFKEVLPELYENIQRSRGRPKSDDPKQAFTLRLPRSVLERWQRDPDWRTKMVETLKRAV
jgi:uncharacterized protein (DUF4415 family)